MRQELELLASLDLSAFVVAVDFDGTCVHHKFPDVGEDVPGAADVLKALNKAGARVRSQRRLAYGRRLYNQLL